MTLSFGIDKPLQTVVIILDLQSSKHIFMLRDIFNAFFRLCWGFMALSTAKVMSSWSVTH